LRRGGAKRKGRIEFEIDDLGSFEGALPASLRLGRGKRGGPRKIKREEFGEAAETKAIKKRIKVLEFISVGDLAHRMGVKANEVIAKLMGLGVMATLNQSLDMETATLVAADFGYEIEKGFTEEQTVLDFDEGHYLTPYYFILITFMQIYYKIIHTMIHYYTHFFTQVKTIMIR